MAPMEMPKSMGQKTFSIPTEHGGTHPYYTNGKGVMPAFSGNLDAEEITFVASYLDSLPVAP